jgi:hypothetical protein
MAMRRSNSKRGAAAKYRIALRELSGRDRDCKVDGAVSWPVCKQLHRPFADTARVAGTKSSLHRDRARRVRGAAVVATIHVGLTRGITVAVTAM